MFNQLLLCFCCVLYVSCFVPIVEADEVLPPPPHIVLIMADDVVSEISANGLIFILLARSCRVIKLMSVSILKKSLEELLNYFEIFGVKYILWLLLYNQFGCYCQILIFEYIFREQIFLKYKIYSYHNRDSCILNWKIKCRVSFELKPFKIILK